MKVKLKDFEDVRKDPLVWMLFHAMNEDDIVAMCNTAKELTPEEYNKYEVEFKLTCCDRELDIDKMFRTIYDAAEKNIRKNARELFEDLVSDKVNSIIESLREIESTCRAVNEQADWDTMFSNFFTKDKYGKGILKQQEEEL